MQQHVAALLNKGSIIDFTLIATVWCIGSLVVNPIGNFPLIDDWAYSRAVLHLHETGDYRPLGWALMTLLSHVLWGALFCLWDGFSFTALRISGLVAGLFGLLGTYILVRDFQQPRWLAIVITFALGSFPAYYVLSHTFMTDVPFAALAIWSAVFLARSIRTGTITYTVVGTAFALVAMLSRQLALALPLAFAITMLLTSRLTARNAFCAIAPFVVCLVALFAFNHWLDVTNRVPEQYTDLPNIALQKLQDIPFFIFILAIFVLFTPIYLGLFLLPFFISSARSLFWSDDMKGLWRSHGMAAAFLVVPGVLAMVAAQNYLTKIGYRTLLPMPDRGNMLGKPGIGPLTLRDSIILNLDQHVATLPEGLWIGLTIMGIVGAVLLIAKLSLHTVDLLGRLIARKRSISADDAASMFLVLCGVVYFVPFVFLGFFDRYLILMIPLLAAGMVGFSGKPREPSARHITRLRLAAFLMLATWGLVSIAGTRDYLTWNRVRWEALRNLMVTERADPKEIDGGFEFNGFYLYDPSYKAEPRGMRSDWWVHRDTYQIGFGAVPDYTVIKEYSYHHWLPPHVQKLVVMRKLEDSERHTLRSSR